MGRLYEDAGGGGIVLPAKWEKEGESFRRRLQFRRRNFRLKDMTEARATKKSGSQRQLQLKEPRTESGSEEHCLKCHLYRFVTAAPSPPSATWVTWVTSKPTPTDAPSSTSLWSGSGTCPASPKRAGHPSWAGRSSCTKVSSVVTRSPRID